jgi:tRNA modification GTPase
MFQDDTIIALSTGAQSGAIAIIRVSGSRAVSFTETFLKKDLQQMPSHTVVFRRLYVGDTVLDEAVITLFKGPQSYTGETVVELALHGSLYITQRLLKAYLDLGARMAEPGEFTRRAFLNGKMDLAQAEAVADLIASEHRFAHEQAMHQLKGGFSADIAALRAKLLHFTSLIELELDFGEEDVEFASRKELGDLVADLMQRVGTLKDSFELGNALKKGFALVLAGRPNAGKSTLFNALLNEDRAIVSAIAGTTRDALEERLNLGDISLRLMDTAGIREATDAIEREGIHRTFKHIESAGATLYVFDPSELPVSDVEADLALLKSKCRRLWVLASKMDVFEGDLGRYQVLLDREGLGRLWSLSAKDVAAVRELQQEMGSRFREDIEKLHQLTVVTNARHAGALERCYEELEHISRGLQMGLSGDLMSFHLRSGIRALAGITGEIDHEEVLSSIFSSFCIGK